MSTKPAKKAAAKKSAAKKGPPPAVDAAAPAGETLAQMKARVAKGAEEIRKAQAAEAGKTTPPEIPPAEPIVASTRTIEEISNEWFEAPQGDDVATLRVKKGMPVEEWVAVVRGLVRKHESYGFVVGDLLNYGQAAYGKTYDLAVIATGLAPKTLANFKTVALSISPEMRHKELSFGIHACVSSLTKAQQQKVLAQAEKEELPVAKVRAIVKTLKPAKPKSAKALAKEAAAAAAASGGTTTNDGKPVKSDFAEGEQALFEAFANHLDMAAIFVRNSPVYKKLGKVDRKSLKGLFGTFAAEYEALMEEFPG